MTDDVAAVISNSDVGFYPLHTRTPIRRIHFYHGTYRGQSEAIRPFIKYGGYLYLKWWNSMVLERFGARGKVVLSCSDYVRDEVSRFFHCDSTSMWYPLDTERFQPRDSSSSRKALGLPEGKVIGLFAGNSQPTKGFPVVEALIEALPDVYWVLAMLGEVPEGLHGRPNARILRNVAHAQMPFLYSAADFLLCPSRYDAFPYVVSESIACGTPVIAAPNGASQLFLREPPLKRLLVSGPDAVGEFISAAREVMKDPPFYRRAVIAEVRPKLVELMAPENWWKRFQRVAGI
jgi:glycosyltransferase involved in cell wall biosynthesis